MKVTLIYAYWPNQPGGVTWCDLPWALRDKGLPKRLHEAGHEVVETILMAEEPTPEEMRAGLVLAGEVSQSRSGSRSAGRTRGCARRQLCGRRARCDRRPRR